MIGLQGLDAGLLAILGLLIGSFLNVVIYRLPVMLEAQWKAECAQLQDKDVPDTPAFNLFVPRSRCQKCNHLIRWFENIPVLSYLVLRGQCANCKTSISWRYPVIEIATGVLFFCCGWLWGATPTGLIWCAFSAALLTLGMIDWDTTLLPDDITLPLLWAGLVAALFGLTLITLENAVWGVVGGYLSLWLVYWAFKLVTGKEGMGYGDFKLFAALGAWFGWQALIPMILMASVIGALVGIAMKFTHGLREGGYVPFGPFLAGAGLTAMLAGTDVMLKVLGL
jgi:leader peptidase (prepilin peptidase)/N-methyltransferase